MRTFWKSALAVVMALILGCSAANAQFRFGIKAGVNLNKLHFNSFKDTFQPDNGCGFTGGIMTEFQVPLIGLCFDASLMYSHMSGDSDIHAISDENTNATELLSQKKDFLEVPINIKYKLGLPIIHPYIFTGPSFAFKLGKNDNILHTKTFQCAWNVGIGVELASHLQIAGSYGFGVNNIMEHVTGWDASKDIKLKNNYWTITAAYLF
ncbi:MAG: porin family protein [Prevotella sp.]|nr:porin family protein [Prevotella sp.]MCM1074906.1 porin family protein [Ruminococcus sp.]